MLSKKIGLSHIMNYLKDSRVLMRVDFNVPLKDGVVKDQTRIKETIGTIEQTLSANPKKIILMSHLGRPDGHRNKQFSLAPTIPVLEDLLRKKVTFLDDCVGPSIFDEIQNAKNNVVVLENLRFHPEEEGSKKVDGKKIKSSQEDIQKFRAQLNQYGNVYVNDAFGAAHRAHSSVVGINCPIRAAGNLMKRELDFFAKALEHPVKPFLVVLGGAKVADKIPLILNLLDKVDEIIIGGAMAFTFLKLKGMNIGSSLNDDSSIPMVKEIMEKAELKGVKIHLPLDFVCADKLEGQTEVKLCTVESGIPQGLMGLDSGQKTIIENGKIIARANTIVWNGPQGVFENEAFRKSSVCLLENMIQRTSQGATTIAGGGDTLNLLKTQPGSKEKLSHVSTGGGASLELLEGKVLPGVNHLTDIEELKKL